MYLDAREIICKHDCLLRTAMTVSRNCCRERSDWVAGGCAMMGSPPGPMLTSASIIMVPSCIELEMKVAEDYAKFYNHGEGPF